MKALKRMFPIILATLVCVLPVFACDCNNLDLGETDAKAEYARVYSLYSDGVTFDFDEHPTFSAAAVATMSGGNLNAPIEMNSIYTHDYREPIKTYSYAKYPNSITERDGIFEPSYDEYEYGFQEAASSGGSRYLESMKTDGLWSAPGEYGNGNYKDTITSGIARVADKLTRDGSRLFDPAKLENFRGGKSGGTIAVGADVKSDAIAEYVAWIDRFLPLLNLKDTGGEWRFFYLSDTSLCGGRLEIKASARMLDEVYIVLNVPGNGHGGDLGNFEFAARMTFTSGGVTVKRLSYFSRT